MKDKRKVETVETASHQDDHKPNRGSDKIYFSHNNFFSVFFEQKQVVESFLKNYLPAEIINGLDFNTLKIDKESFVDKKLSRHFSDILYHIRFLDSPAFVYFLFEHKSREKKKKRKMAPFQFLKYMVQIWDRHLKRHKDTEKLPIIIPMVIYHGREDWEVDRDFFSLFDVPQSMDKYIPKFSFELYDISHMPKEYIRGNILLRIALLTLKYIFDPELSGKLEEIFRLLAKLEDKTRATEYLEILLRYLTNSAEYISEEQLEEAVDEAFSLGGEIMPTIVQRIKNEMAEKYRDELTSAKSEAVRARNEAVNAKSEAVRARSEAVSAKSEAAMARNEAARAMEDIAKKLMMQGMNANEIVNITGLSMEKLKKIISVTH